jgi:hypothetical protein
MVIFKAATLFNKIKILYKQLINLKNCKIINNSILYQQHKILPSSSLMLITVHAVATTVNALAVQVLQLLQPSLI